MKRFKTCWILAGLFLTTSLIASEGVHLDKVKNDLCDKASLQRGAGLYMNYCVGCHSLQYVRFKDMAKDIGIVDKNGHVLEELVNKNLNFITDKVNSPIKIALPPKDGEKWFGVTPPDLSLAARVRGTDWLYTYLRSFYKDPKRPWGVNNTVFPDVAMPHVLVNLQGLQDPIVEKLTLKDDQGKSIQKDVVTGLELKQSGALSKEEYDKVVTDLVNFLDYVGEPHKLERKRLGVFVVLFLVVFTIFAYLLKREYWKDVH